MTRIRYLFLLITVSVIESTTLNNTNIGLHIRIYENIAEISRPITPEQLPVLFSQTEWFDIRADSIRLVGYCLTIRAQIISFNQTSLNGQKVLIQRSSQNETFTEAIMIDETRSLIQDLVDKTFYTITTDRIRYLSIPPIRNYSVNFVYDTSTPDEPLYLRHLQNNLKWKVRYDLLLDGNDTNTILQAYADLRNDGSSSLTIDSAELISGDVNIRTSTYSDNGNASPVGYFVPADGDPQQGGVAAEYDDGSSTPSMISSAEELAGVYIFTINETFTLNPRSNYILPMISPRIESERYGLIEKYFLPFDNRGNAQRAYRLRVPETFLPKGQVFVRESDRLVGETFWLDLSANETNEFTLGQDSDLQYTEYIQLNSRRQAYEANGYRFVLSTYTITLQLINNKARAMNIEYRLKFSSQDHLTLTENTLNNTLQFDGSTLVGIFQLNAHDEQQVKFTFETK